MNYKGKSEMKYKPTPLNIISALIILRVIIIIIGSIKVHEDLNTWLLLIPLIFLILIIPGVLIGIDFAMQFGLKDKKYIWTLSIELMIVLVAILILWFGFNIRSIKDLNYYL